MTLADFMTYIRNGGVMPQQQGPVTITPEQEAAILRESEGYQQGYAPQLQQQPPVTFEQEYMKQAVNPILERQRLLRQFMKE